MSEVGFVGAESEIVFGFEALHVHVVDGAVNFYVLHVEPFLQLLQRVVANQEPDPLRYAVLFLLVVLVLLGFDYSSQNEVTVVFKQH